MPSIADMYIQQGREEGRKRLVKGILKLIQSKFPDLPHSTHSIIASVHNLAVLESIMDHTIEAEMDTQFEEGINSISSH